MQKDTFTRWFLGWFLVWILVAVVLLCSSLGIAVAGATGNSANPPATDPRFAMITALKATGAFLAGSSGPGMSNTWTLRRMAGKFTARVSCSLDGSWTGAP